MIFENSKMLEPPDTMLSFDLNELFNPTSVASEAHDLGMEHNHKLSVDSDQARAKKPQT